MDQEETLKAAIADLRQCLTDCGWDEDYPLDRSTVPHEDSMWNHFQANAKAKYANADPSLKAGIKQHFDKWDNGRRFTAFD